MNPQPPPENRLPPGTFIGPYRIEKRLGEKGGFAFTYLATHTRLNRRVALKELFPDNVVTRRGSEVVPSADPEKRHIWEWALRKFKEEARHLARFRHENIVAVTDLIEANRTAYIVMQYVEGQSFDYFLKHMGRPPSEKELQHIMHQMLDGMEAVHREHILHRDIKPSNIYLTREGRVILLDFGAARPEKRGTAASTIGLFTHGYSPFEQYRSDTPLTAAADIYAAAATMVRAISGKHPPRAFDRQKDDPYVPLETRYRGQYSAKLLRAVDAGMQVDASRRPQSVAQWRAMLDPAVAVDLAPPPKKDRRILIACGLIVGVGICLLALALTYGDFGDAPSTPVRPSGYAPTLAMAPEPAAIATAPEPAPAPPAPPASASLAPGNWSPAPSALAGNTISEELTEKLADFAKQEIEGGVRAANYAPQVKINDTGAPADDQTISRSELEARGRAEGEKYSSSAFAHISCRVLSYNAATDVADVQHFYSFERVKRKGNERELGMTVRLLQIADASKPTRSIATRRLVEQAPGYRCRLANEDHRDLKGRHLFENDPKKDNADAIKEILFQDRLNYDTRFHRDPEDMAFDPLRAESARARIKQVPADKLLFLPRTNESLEAILHGTPVVEIFPDLKTPALIIVLKN